MSDRRLFPPPALIPLSLPGRLRDANGLWVFPFPGLLSEIRAAAGTGNRLVASVTPESVEAYMKRAKLSDFHVAAGLVRYFEFVAAVIAESLDRSSFNYGLVARDLRANMNDAW